MSKDLFGKKIETNPTLADRYFMVPMTVLNSREGKWQARKKYWKGLGIKSEVGRDTTTRKFEHGDVTKRNYAANSFGKGIVGIGASHVTSVFDPVLSELMYKWFCPQGGRILDPFAGGSVRGVVAHSLHYQYTGIEIRPEQVKSNIEQGIKILGTDNLPDWITGDSNIILDTFTDGYDFVFSCPPYADMEVYSDMEGDISNMKYDDFIHAYKSIIAKACGLLQSGSYACFVVGEIRDKKGRYYGFVPDTVKAFQDCGMQYWNEAILLLPVGTRCLTVANAWRNKKLGKVHQNILIFKKP